MDLENKTTAVIDDMERTPELRTEPGKMYRFIKRVFDIAASLAALVILSPVFLILAALIKLDSSGPVIHKRWCVGARGPYAMLKFRSMVADADDLTKYLTPEQIEEYKANIKLCDDPRITRIGRFLRKTSLDELPQLINVLKGEMSFVGPRPVTDEELARYGTEGDELLSVKPGITGYWQTHGRSDSTYESGERQRLELYYVRHQSLWLDICIFFKTFVVVVRRGGNILIASVLRGEIYHGGKRIFDCVVSVVVLVVGSPVLLAISVLIKLDSPGPVLHRRVCVGKNNKTYSMYKFRSMDQDADELFDLFTPEQLEAYLQGVKIDDDPRVTRLGHILRKTSLDEIPQLISVLKGDMSLVGPRPVIEREAAEYGDDREKLLGCKPGITGCWQVEGRGTLPFLSEEAKRLQLYYVDHQSLGLDVRLLFRTVKVVLSREGAK